MLISIVIPVYNVAEYLRPCVESILANDCSDCEIILVNDGSTDGVCPALCDSIAAENPNTVRVIHQENMGLGGARNSGINTALGKYLFFVDGDDTIAPDTLKTLKKTALCTDCDVISFGMCCHGGDGDFRHIQTDSVYSEKPFSLCDNKEFLLSLPGATYRLWKKSLFLSCGVSFPSRVWYEDLRTSTKLFTQAESVCTIKGDFYRYLQREGSIMNSLCLERNREIIDAFDDVVCWFKEKDLFALYKDELCKLAVDHLLIAATVRVAKKDPRHPLLEQFSDYMSKTFPDFLSCPYISRLSKLHKLLFRLICKGRYKTVGLLFRIKEKL